MKHNFFLKATLTTIFISILASCSVFQPAERTMEPLHVEFTQRWGDYTLIVAQEKGFFEEYGVEVVPVYYDHISDTYPDLASGQIDGALIAVGAIININRSAEMKILAISDDGGADSIVANPEINTIKDLQGKTIGVLTGTQYELMVVEMLRSANMSLDDVTLARVNPEDAVIALNSNQVQAIYTWEPFLSQALSNGKHALYPTEKTRLFPNMLVFRKSLVEQRPDDIRAFLQAWFKAVDYRLNNPQEVRSIAASYLGVDVKEVQSDDNLKILTLDDNKVAFDIQNENSVYAITKFASDYLISTGSVAQQVDPLELLDPAYLP